MSNKKYNQIIDEVYCKYADSHWTPPSNPKGKLLSDQLVSVIPMEHSKKSFVNEIKTNSKFSEQWGLKIEERKLTFKDKFKYIRQLTTPTISNIEQIRIALSIPTKIITVTYNNEKTEIYEK